MRLPKCWKIAVVDSFMHFGSQPVSIQTIYQDDCVEPHNSAQAVWLEATQFTMSIRSNSVHHVLG